MKNKLLLTLIIISALAIQACNNNKDEEDTGPQVTQLNSVNLVTGTLSDLTDGTLYQLEEAVNNIAKIDITYSKSITFTDSETNIDTTVNSVLVSPHLLTVNSGGTVTTPFTNETLMAPLNNASSLAEITDPNQLKIMFEQAVADFGSSGFALNSIPAGTTIMFRIRTNTNESKYGGMLFNAISTDSTQANVSIAIQK